MEYEKTLPFNGNLDEAMKLATATLTVSGFRIQSRTSDSLEFIGPPMNSSNGPPLISVARHASHFLRIAFACGRAWRRAANDTHDALSDCQPDDPAGHSDDRTGGAAQSPMVDSAGRPGMAGAVGDHSADRLARQQESHDPGARCAASES